MVSIWFSSDVRSRINFLRGVGVVPEIRIFGKGVQFGETALGLIPVKRCLLSSPMDCLAVSTNASISARMVLVGTFLSRGTSNYRKSG